MDERWKEYLHNSIADLNKIKPKWACGKNVKKALYLPTQLEEGYDVFYVNPDELMQNGNFAEVNMRSLFVLDKSENDNRIARILWHWDNGEFVDPPTIYLSKLKSNQVTFSDGRHRAKLSYFLNLKRIPVIIYNEDVEIIKTIINLKK